VLLLACVAPGRAACSEGEVMDDLYAMLDAADALYASLSSTT
jgi:hypothetical protein